MGDDVSRRVESALDRQREQLVADRRDLHRNPELSYHETRTAALCASRCDELGFDVHTEVGGSTGVIADLDSGRPGPTVMLRADTDALPLCERGADRPVS